MSQLAAFFWSITVPLALGFMIFFAPLGDRRRNARLSLALALLGSLAAVGWALVFWAQPSVTGAVVCGGPLPVEGLPALVLELYVDRLAALFMLLVGGFSLVISIYSFGYLGLVKNGGALENDAHGIAAAYSLFVWAMLVVIAANNVFTLLVSLELISLLFGYLVLFRHNKNRDTKGAAWKESDRRVRKVAIQSYLISSHVSLVLFSAALLLRANQVGDFSFDAFRRLGTTEAGALTFWLAFLGLAIRAGVAPFHLWIPLAYPSSPTNTHALSLGVAIKIAIFLMIRVFFQFLGPIPSWWGPVVMVFAGLTTVVGVYYAIVSRDLKIALAYHSVENVGIILVGVGLALALAADHLRGTSGIAALAGIALIAGLYHTINHAIFKGLLYLCTGAIEKITGTVEYHKLGGLMKRLPWTSASFLIGAVSIAGFPPFNGFISEWLTLQALFSSLGVFSRPARLFPVFAITFCTLLLAAAFGLTAFAFVKITGETLLGAPRTAVYRDARDVPWFTRIVFLFLSGLCLLLGILPSFAITALAQVADALRLPVAGLQGQVMDISLPGPAAGISYMARLSSPLLWLLVSGLLLLVALFAIRRRKKRARPVTVSAPVWTSGIPYDGRHMQATEAYFGYQVYIPLSRSRLSDTESDRSNTEKQSLLISQAPGEARLASDLLDEGLPVSDKREVIECFRLGYNVLFSRLIRFSEWFTLRLQNGDVRQYVLYTFVTLAVLMIVLVILRGR